MDKDIKTRTIVKDIKKLDRKAGISRTIKNTGVKVRDIADSTVASKAPRNRDGQSYAEDKVEQGTSKETSAAIYNTASHTKGVLARGVRAQKLSKEAAQKTSREAAKKTVSATAKAGKGSIKAPVKTIKTAKHTARTSVKSSAYVSQSAKTTMTGGKRAARSAGYSARTAARATTHAAKATTRAVTAFAKMAITAAKSLTTAIAALSTTAVAVVLIICLVGLIAVSAFGIFFTGGNMGDENPTLREVVSEINEEHSIKIEEIKSSNPHDEIALNGTKTPWKEVLAIFAVKTTTDPDNPLDVVTLDETRQKLLKGIFWDMNSIDSRVEEREFTEIVLEEDDNGNPVETNKTSTKKVLYITLSNKSAEVVAKDYRFSSEQLDLLHQLLDKQYDSTWQSVLYGISRGSGDIVEVAIEQLGNVGGQPYWSWYGFSSRVEWCACFVSWCANECGYIDAGIIPKFSYCPTGVDWFKGAGLWQDRGYSPQPGDIIFFDWGSDGVSDHVGIVESSDENTVFTIEGNAGDSCQRSRYSITNNSIMGYGTPLY